MSDPFPLSDFERRVIREIDLLSNKRTFKRVPRGILLGALCEEHALKNGTTILAPHGELDTALDKCSIAGFIDCRTVSPPRSAMHTREDGKVVMVDCRRAPERDSSFGGAPCFSESVTINNKSPPVHWRLITKQEEYTLTRDGIHEARRKPDVGGKAADILTRPTDLITMRVALERFDVSRTTLKRGVQAGDLTDYRKQGSAKNAELVFSEAELAARCERRAGAR